jgi:hypothetical protein
MNNESPHKVDLLAYFGHEDDPSPPFRMPPQMKSGSIDSVLLHLEEDEIELILSAELSDVPILIHNILVEHKDKFEHLCHHFIDPGTQYTLDDESFEIENCEMDDLGRGCAHCVFTASAYWGCRDIDDVADERDCVLDLSLDRCSGTITVSTNVPNYERDPEEF